MEAGRRKPSPSFRGPRTLAEIKRDKAQAQASEESATFNYDASDAEEGEIMDMDQRPQRGEIPIPESKPDPANVPTKKGKLKSKWESDEEANMETSTTSRKVAKRKSAPKKSLLIPLEHRGSSASPMIIDNDTHIAADPETHNLEPKRKRIKTESHDTPSAKTPTQFTSPPYVPSPLPPRRTVDSDGEPTTPRSYDGPSTPSRPSSRPTSRAVSPAPSPTPHLRGPPLTSCRSVDNYEKLNRIDEGAYGIVYRARDKQTGEIVALKKLKLENEKNGFPVTSLREIHTLLLAKHPNIVNVKEIAVSRSLNGIFIVMEYIEHDLKGLMENMPNPFLQSETKTLMLQLLSAVACLHQNWIVHRDLKTSNLLMNNRGMIKVADFGLARRFGDPLGNMTQLVVTLWYRSPELLLGAKEYTTAIDMWSIGCIFGELVNKEPLLDGKGEIDQLKKIFQLLGTPNEKIWPGCSKLPAMKTFNFASQPNSHLRKRFPYLDKHGFDLMEKLLTLDPAQRITAEEALRHPYFTEPPLPKDPSLFPTWPAKSAGEKKKQYASPSAPKAAHGGGEAEEDVGGGGGLFGMQSVEVSGSTGFRLRI